MTNELYNWPAIGGPELDTEEGINRHVRGNLTQTLPSPLYWWKHPDGGRKVYWNLRLIRDYLRNGPGEKHNRLVEEYLASLEAPKAQAASSKQLQEVSR
ncbi:hypothetical protein [Acaryochloris sp. IP29b_bin.148]|uniref:hypothetical protein n=1 Tax=Acaryochloris sp. IP29b_bin.148 TaxID=2969218 RepID=UPI002602190E|nr:hypothetical protein [Acaryochloris sp. IP29b_bin.148]